MRAHRRRFTALPTCRALGTSRAGVYRRRRPPRAREPCRRPSPARALSEPERAGVLEQLHSERFVDASPAQVWATLLDEGTYLASERTMYRLLAADGEVRERRAQLTHPAYQQPELLAEAPNHQTTKPPNQVWSWDITKLKGPLVQCRRWHVEVGSPLAKGEKSTTDPRISWVHARVRCCYRGQEAIVPRRPVISGHSVTRNR